MFVLVVSCLALLFVSHLVFRWIAEGQVDQRYAEEAYEASNQLRRALRPPTSLDIAISDVFAPIEDVITEAEREAARQHREEYGPKIYPTLPDPFRR
jgi:hypothetical protein